MDFKTNTMGKARRFPESFPSKLGPGVYSPVQIEQPKGLYISRSKRPGFNGLVGPGPGIYDIPANFEGPAYSLSGKLSVKKPL